MNRRSLLHLFSAATAAVAMEVLGLMPLTRAQVTYDGPWVWRNEYSDLGKDRSRYYAALMQAYNPQPRPWGMEAQS